MANGPLPLDKAGGLIYFHMFYQTTEPRLEASELMNNHAGMRVRGESEDGIERPITIRVYPLKFLDASDREISSFRYSYHDARTKRAVARA